MSEEREGLEPREGVVVEFTLAELIWIGRIAGVFHPSFRVDAVDEDFNLEPEPLHRDTAHCRERYRELTRDIESLWRSDPDEANRLHEERLRDGVFEARLSLDGARRVVLVAARVMRTTRFDRAEVVMGPVTKDDLASAAAKLKRAIFARSRA